MPHKVLRHHFNPRQKYGSVVAQSLPKENDAYTIGCQGLPPIHSGWADTLMYRRNALMSPILGSRMNTQIRPIKIGLIILGEKQKAFTNFPPRIFLANSKDNSKRTGHYEKQRHCQNKSCIF